MNKQVESESLVEHIQLEYLDIIISQLGELEHPRCLMIKETKVLPKRSCVFTENKCVFREITW